MRAFSSTGMLSISQSKLTQYALAATSFTLPLSSSLKSIFIVLSVLLILTDKEIKKEFPLLLKQSWFYSLLILFLMSIVASFWSPATVPDIVFVIEKYTKLLYLPILVVGFSNKETRIQCIHAFLAAMFVTLVYAMLRALNILPGTNPEYLFRNHIQTSHMMAVAVYICAYFAIQNHGNKRKIYSLFATLFTIDMFWLNTSRTGYIIYCILAVILFIQVLSFRQAIAATMIMLLVVVGIFFHSSRMYQRVQLVIEEVVAYQHDYKETSLGDRLQFYTFAKKLIIQKPLIGNGTASFTTHFDQQRPVASWQRRLWEPHNQYLLIFTEWGLIGLSFFVFFIFKLFVAINKLTHLRFLGLGILIPFLIGCLTDSLLFYSGTGYFFILFMAICLGEGIQFNRQSHSI